MILQATTEDVLTRYNLHAGNYNIYASAVQTLFRPAMLTTLEEYGLPAPLTAHLGRFITPGSPAGQIDDVLDELRRIPPVSGLSRFEEEMPSSAAIGSEALAAHSRAAAVSAGGAWSRVAG